MNRVVLVGRLARDPNELRRSTNNIAAINFTLAVDNRSKQEDKSADFISCVAFNKTAEFVELYFKKGMLVGVDGRLQSRSYDGKDGKKVYVTEVVCENVNILEPKGTRENTYTPNQTPVQPEPTYEEPTTSVGLEIEDNDLPF